MKNSTRFVIEKQNNACIKVKGVAPCWALQQTVIGMANNETCKPAYAQT